MKPIYFIIFLLSLSLIFCMKTPAQNVSKAGQTIADALNSTPGVKVVQPAALNARLLKKAESESELAETASESTRHQGERKAVYRIEAYADNTGQGKANAVIRQKAIQNRFPELQVQLVFDSPFWRVKIGHYSSRSDAEAILAEIKGAFPYYAPYLRIVRN